MSFRRPLSCENSKKLKNVKERQERAFQSHVEHNRRIDVENQKANNNMSNSNTSGLSIVDKRHVFECERQNLSLDSNMKTHASSSSIQNPDTSQFGCQETPTSDDIFLEHFSSGNFTGKYDESDSLFESEKLRVVTSENTDENMKKADFMLGKWLNSSVLADGRPKTELISAIKRWQLRKGRSRPKSFCAAYYAGVNVEGKFIPMLQPFSYSWKGYIRDGENFQHWSKHCENENPAERRLMARCFIRLQKHCTHEKMLKQKLAAMKASFGFPKLIFGRWLNVYHACRYYRLNMVSGYFELWMIYMNKKHAQRLVNSRAQAFHQKVKKMQAIKKWHNTSRGSSMERQRRLLAANFHRLKVVSARFDLWRKALERRKLKVSALKTADMHFFMRSASAVMSLLRIHALKATTSRTRLLFLQQVRIKNCLHSWNERTRLHKEWKTQQQGAALYFDLKLCAKKFRVWKEYTNLMTKVFTMHANFCLNKRKKAVKVFRLHALSRIAARERKQKAINHRNMHTKLRVFHAMVLEARANRQDKDANALSDIHTMRRSFQNFRIVTLARIRDRYAISFWKMYRKRLFIEALRVRRRSHQMKRKASKACLHFMKTKLLARSLRAWKTFTDETLFEKAGFKTAQMHDESRLLGGSFSKWRRESSRNVNLAQAYQLVVRQRRLRSWLLHWRSKCFSFIRNTSAYEDIVSRIETRRKHRVLFAWKDYASSVRAQRRALKVAALHRRQVLFGRMFAKWTESVRLKRSNEEVKTLLEIRMRGRIKQDCFRRWNEYHCQRRVLPASRPAPGRTPPFTAGKRQARRISKTASAASASTAETKELEYRYASTNDVGSWSGMKYLSSYY